MRVSLIYLHVTKPGYAGAPPAEYYLPASQRFLKTYVQYEPGAEHDLQVVYCGAEPSAEVARMYDPFISAFHVYTGAGSDIGACQHALKSVDADFAVCMSTPVYFWRDGWLKRLVEAREKHGDGLYGPMASYQVNPHIRTSCWAVDPATFRTYPHTIETRQHACYFEHANGPEGDWLISKWYADQGKPVKMVTWDGEYDQPDWRKVPNVFRRGDQSNCMVWDQHVDKYFAAHYHERLDFEKLGDGLCG